MPGFAWSICSGFYTIGDIPASTSTQLNTLTDQINAKLEELNSSSIATASNQYFNELVSLNAQKLSLETSVVNLGATFRQNVIQSATALLGQLNAISTSTVYEDNMKNYASIRLNQIINGSSTQSLLNNTVLNNIAGQCRNTGGFAVQNARYLLKLAGLGNVNFNANCSPVTQRSGETIVTKEFSVFPNPSNDRITIVTPDSKLTYEMTISNLLGEKVLSTTVTDMQQVNLSTMGAGVYFVTLSANGKESSTTKLVILRN